jgi:hypothetical protein
MNGRPLREAGFDDTHHAWWQANGKRIGAAYTPHNLTLQQPV